MKSININNNIEVKLTEYGKQLYKQYYIDLFKHLPISKVESLMPKLKTNKKGISEFQLWDFMQLFGKHFSMGNKNIIDKNIIFINKKEFES